MLHLLLRQPHFSVSTYMLTRKDLKRGGLERKGTDPSLGGNEMQETLQDSSAGKEDASRVVAQPSSGSCGGHDALVVQGFWWESPSQTLQSCKGCPSALW